MKLGLDELMIVNPSTGPRGSRTETASRFAGRYFLGGDGTLYQMMGIDSADPSDADESIGRFFLGDDGTLYEMLP